TQTRALMACRFLTMTGRRHTPVAAGASPQPPQEIVRTGQYRYYYHPDVLFNRTTRPVKETAVEFLHARLKAQPGKVTLIAAGPPHRRGPPAQPRPPARRTARLHAADPAHRRHGHRGQPRRRRRSGPTGAGFGRPPARGAARRRRGPEAGRRRPAPRLRARHG